MVDRKYCGKCGNEIPEWANGVCYACARIEYEHTRQDGRAYVPPLKTYQLNDSPLHSENQIDPLLPLNAFNLFLSDVYGKEIHFSDFLRENGIATAKINQWRKSKDFLNCFLEFFEKQLISGLVKLDPKHDPRILSRWYIDNWTIQQVITEFKLTETELRTIFASFLNILRSNNGQDVLKNAIVKAAQAAEETVKI